MKVKVDFLGLPTLSEIIDRKNDVEMSGETVTDLITHLARQFGPEAGRMLLNSEGKLDITIQTMLNNEGFLPRDELDHKPLRDGDTVCFLLLTGGG